MPARRGCSSPFPAQGQCARRPSLPTVPSGASPPPALLPQLPRSSLLCCGRGWPGAAAPPAVPLTLALPGGAGQRARRQRRRRPRPRAALPLPARPRRAEGGGRRDLGGGSERRGRRRRMRGRHRRSLRPSRLTAGPARTKGPVRESESSWLPGPGASRNGVRGWEGSEEAPPALKPEIIRKSPFARWSRRLPARGIGEGAPGRRSFLGTPGFRWL